MKKTLIAILLLGVFTLTSCSSTETSVSKISKSSSSLPIYGGGRYVENFTSENSTSNSSSSSTSSNVDITSNNSSEDNSYYKFYEEGQYSPSSNAEEASTEINLESHNNTTTTVYGNIVVDVANIRQLPTTESDIVGYLYLNSKVKLTPTTTNGWYLINCELNDCYISSEVFSFITEDEYNENTSTIQSSIQSSTQANTQASTQEILGSFTTDYSFSTENRSFNVEKAADAINGKIINKGNTFNWVRDMGPCGFEEGFLESLEYQNGELVTGYGGGICQVSSTLSGAFLVSDGDFEIVERYHHPYEQSYISWAYDATVSYPDCNFVVRNNNNFDVQILASYDKTFLTITISRI